MSIGVKDLFLKGPEIMALACEFNFLPVNYAHSSWLEEVGVKDRLHLLGPRGRRLFSRLLLERRGINDSFWDFEDPLGCIALLPTQLLERIIELAGAALFWAPVARTIEKTKIATMKRLLDEETYYFMLERAPLLVPEKWCPAKTPEERGELTALGMEVFKEAFMDAPAPLQQRVAFKFPMGVLEERKGDARSISRDRAKNLMKKLMAFEVSPSWLRLFTA